MLTSAVKSDRTFRMGRSVFFRKGLPLLSGLSEKSRGDGALKLSVDAMWIGYVTRNLADRYRSLIVSAKHEIRIRK